MARCGVFVQVKDKVGGHVQNGQKLTDWWQWWDMYLEVLAQSVCGRPKDVDSVMAWRNVTRT